MAKNIQRDAKWLRTPDDESSAFQKKNRIIPFFFFFEKFVNGYFDKFQIIQ